MNKILILLNSLCLTKSSKSILAIGIIFIITGCTYTNQVTMAPKVGKMEIAKPIPLEVGLLITEESKNQIFRSPSYYDYRHVSPIYYLEPFQLPTGEAFEKAAFEIFSQVFQKVHLIRSLDEAKNYRLVIEPRLADFNLHLVYDLISYWPTVILVEIQSKAKVSGTLTSKGRTVWQKTIEPPLETGNQVYSSWLKNIVGEQASETIVLGLNGLAIKMMEESIAPPGPVRGWLEEIDQGSR